MSDHKYRAYQPTGSETLEQLVMDPNIPKSETEKWACREIERLRMAVAMTEMSLRAQRRDYIATVCLSAIIVRPDCSGSVDDCARDAIRYADALIARFDKEAILARLDKEAKP